MKHRTRFAPSPTGYLHVGGARTALFSWLHARKHGGSFILRIEDTDLQRSNKESVNAILEGMTWLGLDYDEGPFYQTERFERYREVIQQLIDYDKAYYCYCSKERLDALRAEQMAKKIKPRYDGKCRHGVANPPAGVSPVVRLKNPEPGTVIVNDLIRGRVSIRNDELDDLILARSDGTPTYNLTVVVDDLDMAISHVIRGDDHLNNTPRQINLFQALGKTPPTYAHVPMILGQDGARLSKRHGAMGVIQYRDEGYLPEALLNYLLRLGWSHGDQEIFSLDEMVQLFDVTEVHRAAACFDLQKLQWLNQHYIKAGDINHLAHHLSLHLGKLGVDPSVGPELHEVIEAQRERAKTLVEMAEDSVFYYRHPREYADKDAKKHLTDDAVVILNGLLAKLSALPLWQAEALHRIVTEVSEEQGVKLGKVAQPLRVALTGRAQSPPIDITLKLVGRAAVLERIQNALGFIQQKQR